MKKLLLLMLIWAAAACTTISAQSKLDRFFNKVDRACAEYDRTERAIDNLNRVARPNSYRRSPYRRQDYPLNITEVYRRNQLALVSCDNCKIEIHESFVSVYILSASGHWNCNSYLPRDRYGTFVVATGVQCGNRGDVTVKIMNNRERTMIWFWQGDTLIKGYTVRASYMQSHKH